MQLTGPGVWGDAPNREMAKHVLQSAVESGASDEMHCFHIHQFNFQVVEIDGAPIEFNGTNDIVNILPRSTVKLIMPFTEEYMVGKFVYHCHILSHEDKGMMQVIEVVK